MTLPDFSKLFEDGREVRSADFGRVALRVKSAGELVVSSGRVAAFDPADPEGAEGFELEVGPGRHEVLLSVARFEDGDQRVAGAMLRAGESEPVRWEMALLAGQDASELEGGEVFGYPVDSATGCFADLEAALKFAEAAEGGEELFDLLGDELVKSYVETWSWANVEVDAETGLNVVVFSTGMGDGLYATYAGFDSGGRVVRLVTDFALFEHEELA